MGTNPFAEPDDSDRTVIRPKPSGLRPPTTPPAPPAPVAVSAGPELETIEAGDGPLARAATPLILLLARLGSVSAADPRDMRERTWRELRGFERRARDAGVPPDQMRLAHYALCATLDDVVLSTPWGSQGRWHDLPLARELHDDAEAGRGFFEQLRAQRDKMPGAHPVLQVMMLCLSLGMMGRYRALPDGPQQIERIRHHVFELVAEAAPPPDAALSPQATRLDVPGPPRGGVPVWVAAAAAAAVATGAYVWTLTSLNTATDDLFHAALATIPAAMPELVRPPATPPPPPPPEVPRGPAARLRAALAGVSEVEVVATPANTVLRLPAAALFPQGNATLAPSAALDHVTDALRDVLHDQPGPVRVLAFTDNQPARGVGFPSNFALSTARAKAVRAALAKALPNPAQVTAEGRADAEPLAPNTTPDNRARNRHVDIVVAASP